MKRKSTRMSLTGLMLLMLLAAAAGPAWAEKLPEVGDTLPALSLPAPHREADRQLLGVSSRQFALSELTAPLAIIEIIGVYCPFCYEQAPGFHRLFERLNQAKLNGKVKMFAIAAGGTSAEVDYLLEQGQYNYPIVTDENYAIHKLLGEPRTPFTLVVDRTGKVLLAHQGIIKDIDGFFDTVKELAK